VASNIAIRRLLEKDPKKRPGSAEAPRGNQSDRMEPLSFVI
jgi:hypothetical protein